VVAVSFAFAEFEARYRREYSVFYEFLMSFYDMHVDEDSYFWSAKKVTKNTHGELESFVELVGGMSAKEFDLNDAESAAVRFKTRSAEFADAVDELVSDHERTMLPLFRAPVVRQAMEQGAQEQTRAILGADADDGGPLFDGGLVPSEDGMFWERAQLGS
jgi:halogenation protein CepH